MELKKSKKAASTKNIGNKTLQDVSRSSSIDQRNTGQKNCLKDKCGRHYICKRKEHIYWAKNCNERKEDK